MLPKFNETRRYTRGWYDTKTFSDLEDETKPSLHASLDDNSNNSNTADTIRPESPVVRLASRPSTPRSLIPPPPTVSSSLNTSLRPALSTSSHESLDSFSPSPREERDAIARASPRKIRVSSGQNGAAERGPNVETLRFSTPTSPVRPSPASRPMSPREAAKVSSPRRPTLLRGSDSGHHIAEFEEEEIIEEDATDDTMSSMDLMRAKRRERRRFQEGQARKAHQEFDDENRVSRNSSKYAESVAASSTLSAASSGSKALGTAKYTPQRSHTLLIRRFLQASKRGAYPNSSTASPTSKGSSSHSKRR